MHWVHRVHVFEVPLMQYLHWRWGPALIKHLVITDHDQRSAELISVLNCFVSIVV